MKPQLLAGNVIKDIHKGKVMSCGVCESQFKAEDGYCAPRWWSPDWKDFNAEYIIGCSLLCLLKWVNCEHLVYMHGDTREVNRESDNPSESEDT